MTGGLAPEKLAHLREHYFEPRGEWARARIARVLAAATPRAGERVLDLGCANGTFSFHASRAGARPVGVDRDAAVLAEGRVAAAALGGAATPRVCGDCARLPFRAGAFDLVINADFIEHVPDEIKPAIYREMHRVLRPGGRAVIYSPNRARVVNELRGERLKRLCGLRREPVPRWQEHVDPDHFGMTTPGVTMALLRAAGFRVRVEYHEFHVPRLSRLPGFNALAFPLLARFFANRFLIRCER